MKLKHILILQNKIDLVKESQAREQFEQIQKFVQGKLLNYFYGNWCTAFSYFDVQIYLHH